MGRSGQVVNLEQIKHDATEGLREVQVLVEETAGLRLINRDLTALADRFERILLEASKSA